MSAMPCGGRAGSESIAMLTPRPAAMLLHAVEPEVVSSYVGWCKSPAPAAVDQKAKLQ